MNLDFEIKAGQSLTRVLKSNAETARTYPVYGISELRDDLGFIENCKEPSTISTEEYLPVLQSGELIMSLTSPMAAVVQPKHAGYVLSQNFVEITVGENLAPEYLLFLINASKALRNQLFSERQSSFLMEKIPIKALRNVQVAKLPDIETQRLIGTKYRLQLKLYQLKTRRNELALQKAIEEMRRLADD